MSLNLDDVLFVATLVQKKAAIQIDASKQYLVESRLHALALELGLKSEAELVLKLRRNGDATLKERVVDAMTTNETLFFRDVHPYETLRTTIVPELVKARASAPINIWSAACSTGQEPYSLALLLSEHFPALGRGGVRITATDISNRVLDQARAGRYTQAEVNRGLPAPLLVKHFKQDKGHWQLGEHVRQLVDFRNVNLVEAWPFATQFDLVLVRYVMVYFDHATRVALLERIRRSMRPGAYLLLGGAELLDPDVQGFERLTLGRSVVFRRT
ncbi:MAG: protein-glutamate O-methyltransferase CheR [Polyangiaceae bacterium]|nr:protein-glutamate O-methyltransferase CheR [Polyangiaceae bacterium]